MLEVTRQMNELIEQSEDLDKDKRYMAAADLCDLMLKEEVKIEPSLEKKVCQVFVNQLDDTSSEVSGNAVKCLSQVMSRIQEQQVNEIIQKVMSHLLMERTTLSIYSTCAKQVIGDISPSYATPVVRAFMPSIEKGLELAQLEPREDSIEILTDLLRRFGPNHPSLFNIARIKDLLFHQLGHQSQSIRRRASACFAALSNILQNRQVAELVERLFMAAQKAQGQPLFEITYLQSLAAISRTVAFKMRAIVSKLVPSLLSVCDVKAANIDPGDTEGNDLLYSKVVECLAVLEQLIHGCPKEMTPFIENVVQLVVTRLLAFDPNLQEGADDGEEQEGWGEEWDDQDDYGDELDDIDTSWKLRKSAIKIIVSIVKSRPELLRRLYKSDVVLAMVARMSEREEAVKRDILLAFAGLVASVKRQKQAEEEEEAKMGELPTLTRQESSIQDLTQHVPAIVKALSTQLSKHSSPYSKIKEGVLEVYQAMSVALPEHMTLSIEAVLNDLLLLFKENSVELKVGVMDTLAKLFQRTPHSALLLTHAETLIGLFAKAIKETYYEVQSATLQTISHFADLLAREGAATIAPKLYEIIKERFQASAVDKSVKTTSILALSHLLAHFSAALPKTEVDASMLLLVERAFNESTWLQALQALSRLADSSCDVSKTLDKIVVGLVDLIDKRTGTYKFEVYKPLTAYLKNHALQPASASKVLQTIVKDVSMYDFQISSAALRLVTAVVSKRKDTGTILKTQLDSLINNAVAINGDNLLNEEQLESVVSMFAALSAQHVAFPVKQLQSRAQEANVNLRAISRSLAAIHRNLSAKDQKSMIEASFHEIAELTPATSSGDVSSHSPPVKQLVLALHLVADIGRTNDLSAYKKNLASIQGLFASPIEEVRTGASRCLGCVTVGNLEALLPELIGQLTAKKTHQYLFLESLRQISADNSPALRSSLSKILPLLRLHANSDNEHVQDIVAENLGRIYASNCHTVAKDLFELLERGSDNQRATAALSFRFAVSLHSSGEQFSTEVLEGVLNSLKDPFHQVRKNSLLSFYSILNSVKTADVRGVVGRFQDQVYKQTVVLAELIKEVDLGPFKHKVDKGIPLRRAAFDCMGVMLEQYFEKLELTTFGEVLVDGLKDSAEEVKMKCYEVLVRLIQLTPDAVMSILDRFLEHATTYLNFLEKQIALGTDKEMSLSGMRVLLRTVLTWSRVKSIDQHRGFQDFMQKRVLAGKDAKVVYEELYHKGG